MNASRLFDLLAVEDGDERMLRGIELLLFLHVTARLWVWALRPHPTAAELKLLVAIVATGLALVALRPTCTRRAAAGLAILLLGKVLATFPETSNHALLELLCVGLLACFDRRIAGERVLLLQTCRWVVVIVLFHSGLQKVLYGTYFDAQFLGSFVALKPTFAQALGPLLPAAELVRLTSLPIRAGAGPFAIESALVVALSNAVYVFEMGAPLLLLWRRARVVAAVAAIAFTALLQTAAREMFFGALFIGLLLLFLPRPINLRLLPLFATFYVALVALRWLAPGVWFN